MGDPREYYQSQIVDGGNIAEIKESKVKAKLSWYETNWVFSSW